MVLVGSLKRLISSLKPASHLSNSGFIPEIRYQVRRRAVREPAQPSVSRQEKSNYFPIFTVYTYNQPCMKILFLISLLSVSITIAYAQDKVEREYKIKPSQVPAKALDFVNSSFQQQKAKWYVEQSTKGKSIEAKIRKDGKLHSVEFDTTGLIQDVEVLVDYNSIPEALQKAIEISLNAEFSRFKIRKVQKQWTAAAADLHTLIKGEAPQGKYTTNYEIVITGRKDNHSDNYEVLFNEQGELMHQSRILESNNQHLLF